MEMMNMKMDKDERAPMEATAIVDKPEYPYGLRLNLDEKTIKKLGVGDIDDMPELGKSLLLHAKVDIVSMGKDPLSLSLQITDMALEKESIKKPAEEALYGLPKKQGNKKEFMIE